MFDYIVNNGWHWWLGGVLLAYPMAVILLGEFTFRMQDKYKPFEPIIKATQYFILPNLIIMLMLTSVFGYADTNIIVKITKTIFWVAVIYASVSLFNILMFNSTVMGKKSIEVPKLLLDFFRVILIAIGVALVLSAVWEVDLGKMLTALGVGSVVLGLALQDTLSGIFSGLALLSGKQFSIGDWLKVDDIDGKVEGMDWRSVTLQTRENDLVVIPNIVLAKEKFRNYSQPTPIHMEHLGFDISFDDAPSKVKEILLEVARKTEGILREPEPSVALVSYDEFSIHYDVRYFIDGYDEQQSIRDSFVSKVWYAAQRDGFVFPTRSHEVYNFEGEKYKFPDTKVELIKNLKSFSLFKLQNREYVELADSSFCYSYGEEEEILLQGDSCKTMYIIIKGEVEELYLDLQKRGHNLATLSKNNFFGMNTLMGDQLSLTTFIAKTDVDVLIIKPEAIQKLLDRYPSLSRKIGQVMESREKSIETIENSYKKRVSIPNATNKLLS